MVWNVVTRASRGGTSVGSIDVGFVHCLDSDDVAPDGIGVPRWVC